MAKQQLNGTQTKTTPTTSEVDTGKVWVDGRTIYRKVVRGSVTLPAGSVTVAHGITGLTTSFEFVSVTGGIKIGAGITGTQQQSLAYRESGGNYLHINLTDQTNVTIQSSFAWGASYLTLILEYVK